MLKLLIAASAFFYSANALSIDPKYLVIDSDWQRKLGYEKNNFSEDPVAIWGDVGQQVIIELQVDPSLCQRKSFPANSYQAAYCDDLKKSGSQPDPEKVQLPGLAPQGRFSPYMDLIDKTRYAAGVAVLFFGAMTQLPDSFTNWQNACFRRSDFMDCWQDHQTGKPVKDKDSWKVNLIGHPLSGSAYYTMARNTGLSRSESFIYSFLMSTFLWEYGIEATAEPPSIQDLIFTPLIGSLIGEISYQLIEKINRNDGKVLGSKTFGTIVKALLAPLDTVVGVVRKVLEPIFGEDVRVGFHYGPEPRSHLGGIPDVDNRRGYQVKLRVTVPLPVGWDQRLLKSFQ